MHILRRSASVNVRRGVDPVEVVGVAVTAAAAASCGGGAGAIGWAIGGYCWLELAAGITVCGWGGIVCWPHCGGRPPQVGVMGIGGGCSLKGESGGAKPGDSTYP
jgi:hypothetical protein